MSSRLASLGRSALRQPLVHFVVVGVLLFAVDQAMRDEGRTIVINDAVRAEVRRAVELELGHPPSAAEFEAGLLRWQTEEVLYREGVKRGMLEEDLVVRSRVVAKMLDTARESLVAQQPSEQELRAYFAAHRQDFLVPPSYDLELVFVSKARPDPARDAAQLLTRLGAGEAPTGLGDPMPRGHTLRRQSEDELERLLGAEAARALADLEVGIWRSFPGARGIHLLRVTSVRRGVPEFEAVRPTLELAVQAQKKEAAAKEFTRALERDYEVVHEP